MQSGTPKRGVRSVTYLYIRSRRSNMDIRDNSFSHFGSNGCSCCNFSSLAKMLQFSKLKFSHWVLRFHDKADAKEHKADAMSSAGGFENI